MPKRLLLTALLAAALGSLASMGSTDSLLTVKSHADAFELKGETQPAKDNQVRIWVTGDKIRRDEGDTSMILRLDRNKLFLIHHPEKTYNEMTLPVDFVRLMPKGKEELGQTWAKQMRLTVKVTPGTETKKINGWSAQRVQMDVVSAMGMKIGTTLWISKDIASYATLNKLTAALAALQPGAADWSQKLNQLEGFPVLKEDDVDALGAHFKTREELVSVEAKEAPAGIYDPPASYKAEPFNPLQEEATEE
jgi:Domain of unknown function (DUF4412)